MINKMEGKMNEMCSVICCGGDDRDVFMEMSLRQLEEMLGVAEVRLIDGGDAGNTVALRLEKCKHGKCLRCRKLVYFTPKNAFVCA